MCSKYNKQVYELQSLSTRETMQNAIVSVKIFLYPLENQVRYPCLWTDS